MERTRQYYDHAVFCMHVFIIYAAADIIDADNFFARKKQKTVCGTPVRYESRIMLVIIIILL